MPSRAISSATTPPTAHQGDARLHVLAGFRPRDLGLAHAHLAHALARAIDQHRPGRPLHAAHRQVLLLRGHPLGHVEFGEAAALARTRSSVARTCSFSM
jgi:hypothetical protein